MTSEQTVEIKQPPIDEIVGLLEKHDPAILEQLRQQYPNQRDVLTIGKTLGSSKKDDNLRFKITACLTGLTSGIKVCEKVVPQARQKLKRANFLRFAGEIVTVIAGASIFTVLAANFPDVVRYVVAVLALVGAFLALAAQFTGGTFHPAAGNLFDYYKEVIDCQIEARRIHQELEFWSQANLKDFNAADLIKDGNVICARIIKAANYMT